MFEGEILGVRWKISPLSFVHLFVPLLLVFFDYYGLVVSMSVLYVVYQYLDRSSEPVWITKWNLVEFMAGISIGAFLRFVWRVVLWV